MAFGKLGRSFGRLGAGVGDNYTPSSAALAFIARMVPAPSAAQANAYARYYDAIVASGWSVVADGFWEADVPQAQWAALNFFSTSFTLLPVAAPTFTPLGGWDLNGTTQYLDTQYTANGAGNYKQNSGAFGLFCGTSAQAAGSSGADTTGTFLLSVDARTAADQSRIRVNDNTASVVATTDGKGMFVGSRAAAGTKSLFIAHDVDGIVSQTDFSVASTGLPTSNPVHFGNITTVFTAARMAGGFIGGAMTPAQVGAIAAARFAFRASMGSL